MLLDKNDDIELHIDSVSLTGSGVGRYNGLAVFVPATAPGDFIKAHIIKAKKSYAVGKCIKITEPSPDRTENDCPVYPGCGGCSFRHMSYGAELNLKADAVRDAFSRIGGLEVDLKPIIGAESPDGYRNKAQYPVGRENWKLKIGFYSRRSHRIVDCRACRLAPPEFEKILGITAEWIEKYNISVYDEISKSGAIRHIYLRKAFATGEIMLCLVSAQENLPNTDALLDALKSEESIKSVLININSDDTNAVLGGRCICLFGDGCITDILCGVKVRISPLSFYQVNRAQAERLYKKAAEYAGAEKIKLLLDLYCGAGTIGLSMADRAEELIGIETVAPAVEDAKKNLITVPIVGTTIPHEVIGKFGTGSVVLKPAPEGSGVIAGGPARAVIETAGIRDIVTKSYGTNNPINMVKATLEALKQLRSAEQVAKMRGKTVEELLG